MNNKLRTFMIGRYGIDELYKVLLVIYTILILINIFITKRNIRIEILICIRNVLIVGRKLDYHLKKENILLNVLSVVINLK